MSYFDAIEVGRVDKLGPHRFEADEIVRFARRFDPQPFHLDPEAASRSVFGALCASGWHTVAVFMRLNVEHAGREAERCRAADLPLPGFGPSPGISDLRWLRAVFAGETVAYRQTIVAKRASASRPDWGLVSTSVDAATDAGEPVLAMKARVFVALG